MTRVRDHLHQRWVGSRVQVVGRGRRAQGARVWVEGHEYQARDEFGEVVRELARVESSGAVSDQNEGRAHRHLDRRRLVFEVNNLPEPEDASLVVGVPAVDERVTELGGDGRGRAIGPGTVDGLERRAPPA